jgi:glycosyltransferase involved in cell wall biosynthesis
MNIAIISSHDIHGGAARAAYRLHKGLRLLNQQPVMIVRKRDSGDPDVFQVQSKRARFQVEQNVVWIAQKHVLDMNRTDRSNTFFSLPYPGYDISGCEPIRQADVINLHWVTQFQSVESVARLLSLGKPVVWTLHDENPYTGGCHYTAGCQGYRADCRDCPQLKYDRCILPSRILENKCRYWRHNLTIVTPSRWLTGNARQSKVFQKYDARVIPNSIETDLFRPQEKASARAALQIDPETLCILFNAEYHSEKRKGFRKLLEALEFCQKNRDFKKLVSNRKVLLLTVGNPQQELIQLGIPFKFFGYLKSDERLAEIYSAADIYVLPSLEDNLPNTMLEAMACGTPVVSFKVGGMLDMIQNGQNGMMVAPFDSQALGGAILKLAFDHKQRAKMLINCRRLIEENYRLEHQATAYSELFQELASHAGKRALSRNLAYRESIHRNEKDRKIVLSGEGFRIPGDFLRIFKECLSHNKEQQRTGAPSRDRAGEGNWQRFKGFIETRILYFHPRWFTGAAVLTWRYLNRIFRILKYKKPAAQGANTKKKAIYDRIPGYFKGYERKIDVADQLKVSYGSHRSGWGYAIQCFKELHNPAGVLMDTFIERTFYWHPRGIRPHLRPWIGFFHVPPTIPEWFMSEQSNDRIIQSPAFQQSLPFCRGIFVLSKYHQRSLKKKIGVPINALIHPTEIPDLKWTWDRFRANKEKKLIQIGWWLRKFHSIFLLKTDRYKKVMLGVNSPHARELMQREADMLKKRGIFSPEMYRGAAVVPFLPNSEYDRWLSENIVFIDLYNASANNVIIECLARSTPILVNPLPPVKEYLGKDYPLYFTSLEEAAAKAEDVDLVYKAHQYLLDHSIKPKLKREYFLDSFIHSDIYTKL